MANGDAAPVEDWKLRYLFEDANGNPILGSEQDCAIGSYTLSKDGSSELTGPACATCKFNGGLGDIFNPDEERFEPGASECYKKAAAAILTQMLDSPMGIIQDFRPETAEIIESYAALAEE